ncbi:hypothetical protein HOD38_01560 [archaeon]|jgi:hypothetical protein|nr:hypothetical protein [archaeon]MBT4396932.1 hypothetical protein [archaeon]MBT4440923.1 hypothetical protein [archaeon]
MSYVCQVFGFKPPLDSRVAIELSKKRGQVAKIVGSVAYVDPDEIHLRDGIYFSAKGKGLKTYVYTRIRVDEMELAFQL